MTSTWALPRSIEQYAEPEYEQIHVPWVEVDNFAALKNSDGKFIKTSRDLVHIARDPRHDVQEKTYYLRLTDFNFENLPDELSGIQAKITMNRSGRITDDTVQLCLDSELVGRNQASLLIPQIAVYGGENNIWNTNLTMTDIANSSFGIVLRFRSHPDWPHKSSALIDAVELRIF